MPENISGQGVQLVAYGIFLSPPISVNSLPAAVASLAGARATVNDSNTSTFNATPAAGGSITVPVYCDGAVWRVG